MSSQAVLLELGRMRIVDPKTAMSAGLPSSSLSRRRLGSLLGACMLTAPRFARAGAIAQGVLRVGDQKGGARSLMQAAGVLDGMPYGIEWSVFAGAPMLLQAMHAEAVDLGGIGDAPLAFALAGGALAGGALAGGSFVRAVAAERSDGISTALIVARNSPVHDIAGLRGKSIATLRGQTGHYLVLAALRQARMKPGDVSFVFIPPAAAKTALRSGSVDAWATWGPYIAQAKIVDGAKEIVNGRTLMSGLGYLVATPPAIAVKHAAIADFLARLGRAQSWARGHLDAYAAMWASEIGFPLAVAREVVAHLRADIVRIDPQVIASEQQVADFMHESGMLPAPLDVASGFDRSF